ncbi:MAG: hypothetical protein CW338_01980 [Clostridiales bacterium]|nr:hypothetical protein [Clostridiales bacterium]
MLPFIGIGETHIASYGLMMALGLIVSVVLGLLLSRKCCLRPADFFVIAVCSIVCALLGAVLMYILVTYPLSEIWRRLIQADWEGFSTGYVFYGGLLGGVPGFFLGRKLTGARLDSAMRPVLTVIPLGHAMGRVGCFLAGCCYGMEYSGPLAVTYPETNEWTSAGTVPRFPVQLLEAALLLCLFAVLLILFLKGKRGYVILLTYAGSYSVIRFLLEYMRGDAIRGKAWIFSTAQWVSLVLFTGTAVAVTVLLILRKKHPEIFTPAVMARSVPDDEEEWDMPDDGENGEDA